MDQVPQELRQVHELWREVAGEAFAPSLKAFDLMRLPVKLIPFTSITDFDDAADRFTIRFFGTGLAAIDGIDLTGHHLDETPHPRLRECLDMLFRDVVETRRENFAEFSYLTLEGARSMSLTGRWPLSDDGQRVTAILSVIYPETDLNALNDVLGAGASDHRVIG